MSEEEYAKLHEHPDMEFVAQSLTHRLEQAQKEQEAAARHDELEQHLRRQQEASGGAVNSGRAAHQNREARAPRALEYPTVPDNLIFKGSSDRRQSTDFIQDWEQLTLYVKEEFKIPHLLTALSHNVRLNLQAALRSHRYNNGQGYRSPTEATQAEIAAWLKLTYDQPDHTYRSIIRFKNLKMRNEQTLDDFLRERDLLINQLQRHGVMQDAQTSRTMLVAAVTDRIRVDLMREPNWCDMTEQQIIQSMKTKQLAVNSASKTDHGGGNHRYNHLHGRLMMLDGGNTPGGNINNAGGRGAKPKRAQKFDVQHFAYSTRSTPQPHQQRSYRRPQQGGGGRQNVYGPGAAAAGIRKANYNLRQRQPQPQPKLGLRHMKHLYRSDQWSRRVDNRGKVLATAQPWLPHNRELYDKDADASGQKFCLVCQRQGHDMTTCPAAHAKWKRDRGSS